MRRLLPIGVLCALLVSPAAAWAQATPAVSVGQRLLDALAPAEQIDGSRWSLVALYDGAAVARLQGDVPGLGFSWQPDPALEIACGRSKGPIGLGGQMDAELMARALSPYLVVLLVGPAGVPLSVQDLTIFAGDVRTPFWLAPAVLPRSLQLSVSAREGASGAEASKMVQQIQSQLIVQLCLEHQVGRGWRGLGSSDGLGDEAMQNTFMLDRVDAGDRRLFVGQGVSVPPLLGPPVWAPTWAPRARAPIEVAGAELNAGDLFAFRAPPRKLLEEHRGWSERWMTLSSGGVRCDGCAWRAAPSWGTTELDLVVSPLDGGLGLSATYTAGILGEQAWEDGATLPVPSVRMDGEERIESLQDVLSAVPYEYPRLEAMPIDELGRPAGEPTRSLAVLLFPNWQLANARTDLQKGDYRPLAPLNSRPVDGVGWFIENPENLHVVDNASGIDLMEPASSGSLFGPWGPSPGFRSSAAPIVVAGVEAVLPAQQAAAVRAGTGHLMIVACLILLIFVVSGLARLPDLWTSAPRERALGWPARKRKGVKDAVHLATTGEALQEEES